MYVYSGVDDTKLWYSSNPKNAVVAIDIGAPDGSVIVDRLTTWDLTVLPAVTGVPFSKADALWTSFQKGVSDFVNKNGGKASAAKQEIYRPKWEQVKAVIDGKAPLSSLSTDCK